jgi:hypothetical protein
MASTNGFSTGAPAAGARLADGVGASATRLALRDVDAAREAWDGVWWPHTRLLIGELPGLIAAVAGRYGDVARVSYSLVFWDDAPRSLAVDDRIVRLGGSATTNPYSLTLGGSSGAAPVELLVVAPEADTALAARSLDLAAGHGGPLTWAAGPGGPRRPEPTEAEAQAERTWESEGGPTRAEP